jgi:hypothetical protein
MSNLHSSYRAVIDHITADIETQRQGGQKVDEEPHILLQERYDWLVNRLERLNDQRDQIIFGFTKRLDDYLRQCENFWQSGHTRTYEKRMQQLQETKQRVAKIYSLTGWDACIALTLALKHLRGILPLTQYPEHAPALAALEAIKTDCYEQLGTYLKD